MKKQLFCLVTFLILVISQGQAQITFLKKFSLNYSLNAACVKSTSDKGFIIVGNYYDDLTGNDFMVVIKTDSIGNIQWSNYYGANSTISEATSIVETNNSFIITGGQVGINGTPRGLIIAKLTKSGIVQWDKSFYATTNNYLEGWGYGIEANQNRYAAVGVTNSNARLMFVETDTIGNVTHKKVYGDSISLGIIGYDLQSVGLNNGYIITGSTRDTIPQYESQVYLLRIDSSANIKWAKIFKSNTCRGTSIKKNLDNGFIIAGNTFSGIYNCPLLIKTDSLGNIQWAYKYNFNSTGSIFSQVCVAKDSGYVAIGEDQGVVFKTDKFGNVSWAKKYDITDYAKAIISVDSVSNGGFIMAGMAAQSDSTSNSILLIRTDMNGMVNCNEANIVINKSIFSPVILTWGSEFDSIVSSSIIPQLNSLMLSESGCTVGIKDIENNSSGISVFPNPFSSETTLQADKFFKEATLTVYNSFGQTVKQIKNISEQIITLHRDNLPSGMYFLRLTQNNKTIAIDKISITDK